MQHAGIWIELEAPKPIAKGHRFKPSRSDLAMIRRLDVGDFDEVSFAQGLHGHLSFRSSGHARTPSTRTVPGSEPVRLQVTPMIEG